MQRALTEDVLVNGAAGIPDPGTRVAAGGVNLFNALDPTAGAVIELDAPVDILNTDTIGFGFNQTRFTLDTNDLDGAVAGAAITLNGVAYRLSLRNIEHYWLSEL